jgi:hypothetical protein
MASKISNADLFAITIPAERVTLTHRQCRRRLRHLQSRHHYRPPSSVSPTPPMYPQQMDGVNLPQHPLVRFLPIVRKTEKSSSCKKSPTAGYPPVESDTASTPISPTLALLAKAETKLATTLCDAAITVAQNSITHNLTNLMTI